MNLGQEEIWIGGNVGTHQIIDPFFFQRRFGILNPLFLVLLFSSLLVNQVKTSMKFMFSGSFTTSSVVTLFKNSL